MLTRHGTIRVAWQLADGHLTVETELPAGVAGILSTPGSRDVELQPGREVHNRP